MNDHESFLSAIRDATDKREARLIYADWLEEQGDPRGELLRACVKEIDDGESSDWREQYASIRDSCSIRDLDRSVIGWISRAHISAAAQSAIEGILWAVRKMRDDGDRKPGRGE